MPSLTHLKIEDVLENVLSPEENDIKTENVLKEKDVKPALYPERKTLKGRYVTLEPLCPVKHSDSIYYETHRSEEAARRNWKYLLNGPFPDRESFRDHVTANSASQTSDHVYYAIVDNVTGKALGWQRLTRIDVRNRVVEIGYVLYGESLQRTRGSTEAQYLLARYVFEDLGFRRYEWKSMGHNGPSKRAALRLGFTFEGVFRKHIIYKGCISADTAWFSMLDQEWPQRKAAFEAWLHPDNFDAQGRQLKTLNQLH